MRYPVIAILLFAFMLLTACVGGGSSRPTKTQSAFVPTNVSSRQTPIKANLTPTELQAAVMSHADTTISRIFEAANVLEKIGTPQARLTAARMMVFDVASYVEIASGPYPGIALLDLMVLTSLKRMVWEEFWVPKFGPEAMSALEFIKENEAEIWEIAAKIMTQSQLDEMAQTILRWRKRNPKVVGINYIRFAEFGELGLKPSMQQLTVPGGLFASVKQATMVAQDMKVAIDRAFYLMSRMQLVVNFQVKLAYLEIMFQPETDGIITQAEHMNDITKRYAEIAEKLPREFGQETSKLVNQVFANLEHNREKAITDILSGMTVWQAQTIKGIMSEVSQEREAAINQALAGLVTQQKELHTLIESIVDQSGSKVEESLNHAFGLGVLLIIVFFAALTLFKIFVIRPMKKS
ncbi:hypothetical protein [uncultured Pseudodesulfovibrio sp.]|uniref:hypothetical protein n=1 Tax=uncultured Pseudodesulfovibrio sp. TaxID=2035858 RepID=UPI0029C87D4D|nr:hypothetical protein [uncultured Pseudodesulfovibrio sp.]